MTRNESIHRYWPDIVLGTLIKALGKLASGSIIYQLKHHLACLHEKYSTRGCVSRQIQHTASPRAVFVSRHAPSCCIFIQTRGGALMHVNVIQYYVLKVQ